MTVISEIRASALTSMTLFDIYDHALFDDVGDAHGNKARGDCLIILDGADLHLEGTLGERKRLLLGQSERQQGGPVILNLANRGLGLNQFLSNPAD